MRIFDPLVHLFKSGAQAMDDYCNGKSLPQLPDIRTGGGLISLHSQVQRSAFPSDTAVNNPEFSSANLAFAGESEPRLTVPFATTTTVPPQG
jgi:hypothetical protein